jgi:hypothetical protein
MQPRNIYFDQFFFPFWRTNKKFNCGTKINFGWLPPDLGFQINNSGVKSKNNEYHIVDKFENVCVSKYIFDLIDNVVFVVLAFYSRIINKSLYSFVAFE